MYIMNENNLDSKIEVLKEALRNEIPAFSETGHKFLGKEISSAEFKAASGGMGVYAERSGDQFMIRLRVLSGVLDLSTLQFVNELVNEYSLDFIHLTTRQTIQLHHLQFDDLIKIMERGLQHNIITRGGGGNYPRNVSLSPLSGVEKGEAFDVTPYAIFVNKYFVSRINQYRLPRKFKVAFSNNGQDSANASIADLGFLAVNDNDNELFRVFLGGSMGPNEAIAVPFDELVRPRDILYHVEAALSLFQEEGDYQNKGKARMRFIVKRMGSEAFLECYKKHLEKVTSSMNLDYELRNVEKVLCENIAHKEATEYPENLDTIPQKQNNLYSVVLHPQGGILKAEDLGNLFHFLKDLKSVEIRLAMDESMIVRNLTLEQATNLLNLTKEFRTVTRLNRSISCIGVPICQIGIQSTQSLLSNILKYFEEKGFMEDILPSLSISGCPNSCARHQVSEIGFQGKKKRVNDVLEDAYALQLFGNASDTDTHLANEYGDILARDIQEFLYQLAITLRDNHMDFKQYRDNHKHDLDVLIGKYQV